jgi:predicted nucleic acid-binding protein
VLNAAEEGKVEIVISALTIAEVLALRGKQPIPSERAETLRRFFRRQFFLTVDVDRFIAERARELVWGLGIKPKDAIHVATALSVSVSYFDTFDSGLLAKSGKVGGEPPLTICKPGFGMQQRFRL